MTVRGKPVTIGVKVGHLAITEHMIWLGADVTLGSRPVGSRSLSSWSSTAAFKRPSDSSQRREMRSRERRTSARGSGRSCQSRSRPAATLRARPAPASTRRCLVTACRVTSVPSVSRAIERGPSAPSRATRRRRVRSPERGEDGRRAGQDRGGRARPTSPRQRTSRRSVPGGPAVRVHPIRLLAAGERDAVEPGLHDPEARALRDVRRARTRRASWAPPSSPAWDRPRRDASARRRAAPAPSARRSCRASGARSRDG